MDVVHCFALKDKTKTGSISINPDQKAPSVKTGPKINALAPLQLHNKPHKSVLPTKASQAPELLILVKVKNCKCDSLHRTNLYTNNCRLVKEYERLQSCYDCIHRNPHHFPFYLGCRPNHSLFTTGRIFPKKDKKMESTKDREHSRSRSKSRPPIPPSPSVDQTSTRVKQRQKKQ
jgi:hypothetical protein